jgi:molybdopterin converting factor small subunit
MNVRLPTPVAEYTGGERDVQAHGANLAELLDDLDRRYPGLRFRLIDEQGAIRPHIRIFVNREMAGSLGLGLAPGDEVLVVAALSGG